MTADLLTRYLHFISLIVLIAAVLGQHVLLKPKMTRGEIARLQRFDLVYVIMVLLVLATGFAQWFWVGKPADFYAKNPIFHTKITIFLLVGIASIYPSVFFAKGKKGEPDESVDVPKGLVWSVRVELLLLFLMPLLASLMARGVGIPLVEE
ncbi:MAG: DUF2214 family protein [Verrucomicrobiota bacterium]